MKWFRIVDAPSIILAVNPGSILDNWSSYLSNVDKLLILIQNRSTILNMYGFSFEFSSKNIYFLTSMEPPFKCILEEPSRLGIESIHHRYVQLVDGSYATCLIAYELSDTGLEKLFQDSRPHEIIVVFWDATQRLRMLHSITRLYRKQLKHGTITSSGEILLEDLEKVLDNVSRGGKLLRFLIIVISRAFSIQELQENARQIITEYATYGLSLEQTPFIQDILYNMPELFQERRTSRLLPELYSDSRSLRWTYPIASQDLVEPNGVLIGRNIITGGPVIINIYEPYSGRTNWHVIITGITGAGKTFTASVLTKRMVEQYDPWTFIIDPMSNWTRFACELDWSKTRIVEFDVDKGAGLDPIKLIHEKIIDPGTVVDFLIRTYGISEKYRGRLLHYVTSTHNYRELVHAVREHDLKLQIESLLADECVYSGELTIDLKKYHRYIFGLRNIVNDRLKAIIMTLLSLLIMNFIMKLSGRKLLLIDEFHLIMNFGYASKLAELIVRMGRAAACSIVLVTQSIIDFAKSSEGKVILENVSTKIFLRDTETAIDNLVQEGLKREDIEKYVLNAARGQGILKTGIIKIPIQVIGTLQETRIFRTE